MKRLVIVRLLAVCLPIAALAAIATLPAAEASEGPDADAFGCMLDMAPVRRFFVANLKGDLEATLAVAEQGSGSYPEGSVVQLVPTEVMVKRAPGTSPATRDWEFLELDVSAEGTDIRARGFVNVDNQFGGNCFACHVKAAPDRDLICEQGHGCDPIPLTTDMVRALQKTDPRCDGQPELSAAEARSLEALQAALAAGQE